MPGKIFLAVPGGGTSYPYTPADVAGSTGPLTVLGGTLTGASTPVLNLTQTWNNAATTFTGELINITDTASNAASLIKDWQVGGVKKASITKGGAFYSWNSYTDASNYERGVFDWTTTANTLTIGTVAGGTGTLRDLTLTANNVLIKAASGSQVAFYIGGTARWWVQSTGHFYPNTDNTTDIGLTSNRPRSLYVATNLFVGATSVGTSGVNVIAILNSAVPTTSPANTGQIYNDAGALKYRSPAGTITTIAPA